MILTIRPATREEAEWVGRNLREEDREEVIAGTGRAPEEVLPLSFDLSEHCYTIRLTGPDGKPEEHPAVIFGVAADPLYEGVGLVWLLATRAIARAPLSILKEASFWLDHFNRQYRALHNIVYARNDLHLRWLQLTGFQLRDTVQHNGHDYIYAVRFPCVNP